MQIFSGGQDCPEHRTPGSYGILHTSAQMIHHFVDVGMNVQEAIEAPRFRHYDTGEIFYEDRVPRATLDRLAQMGHKIGRIPGWTSGVGGGHGIQFTEFGTLSWRRRPPARRGGGRLVEHTESNRRGNLVRSSCGWFCCISMIGSCSMCPYEKATGPSSSLDHRGVWRLLQCAYASPQRRRRHPRRCARRRRHPRQSAGSTPTPRPVRSSTPTPETTSFSVTEGCLAAALLLTSFDGSIDMALTPPRFIWKRW